VKIYLYWRKEWYWNTKNCEERVMFCYWLLGVVCWIP